MKKGNIEISAIVIAKNEEEKIKNCLKSLSWCSETIVVDSGSIDKTIEISERLGARIVKTSKETFSDWRNVGLKKALGEWVFYLDADERVEPSLKREIIKKIKLGGYDWYAIPRKNIILGRVMTHGGWYPDYVKRLFRKNLLKGWKGDLHEEPVVRGKMGYLQNDIMHIKHANLSEMVEKTNKWSELEAKLLNNSGHPKMSWWRFLRVMGTELFSRLIVKRGFLDGGEGIIYSFYQSWSRFLSYAKLWEIQLKKTK